MIQKVKFDWTPPDNANLGDTVSLARELGQVDSEDPDVALAQLPFKLAYYTKLEADMRFEERRLKQLRDSKYSQLYLAAKRGAFDALGVKGTEKAIESFIEENPDYRELQNQLNEVTHHAQILNAIVSALASKERVLTLLYAELKRQKS